MRVSISQIASIGLELSIMLLLNVQDQKLGNNLSVVVPHIVLFSRGQFLAWKYEWEKLT